MTGSKSYAWRAALSLLLPVAVVLALDGCSPTPPPKKPAPVTGAGAPLYLQNLALAHETLERAPGDTKSAAAYIARMNRYALKKGARSSTPLTVAVLGFRTRDDGHNHTLIVPISSGKNPDFGNLREAVHALALHKPEYRTVQVRQVNLSARDAVPSNVGPGDVSKINDLYQTVAESALALPKLDAARSEIALTRFFLNAGIRDAAYVSLETAKDLLAGADTSRTEDADEVQSLSEQLETLENTLHKKLPYTF